MIGVVFLWGIAAGLLLAVLMEDIEKWLKLTVRREVVLAQLATQGEEKK